MISATKLRALQANALDTLFTQTDLSNLTNALRIAAETFVGHAKEMRSTAEAAQAALDEGAQVWIYPNAANRLAEQFDRQAADAVELSDRLTALQYDLDEEEA